MAVSSCFDPPEFSNIPKIQFRDIQFRVVEGDNDQLILTFDFKDGDGDVGLNPSFDFEAPYNSEFYYLHDGEGDTIPIIPRFVDDGDNVYTVLNPTEIPGKIVTRNTRNLPNYGYLPAYNPSMNCYHYKTSKFIFEDDILDGVLVPESSIVDDGTYEIEDYFMLGGRKFALISDLLLYKVNPNAFNVEVRFWQFENGSYVEYDWRKVADCQNFFGQFETSVSSTYPKRPIEGTVRYTMPSDNFISTFGGRAIKVSVRIRDRALNVSNTVESPVFELDEIQIN